MELVFLGTGGATSTPKPGCICNVCKQARRKGPPYERLGPSIFLRGSDTLFDTPEQLAVQLNREGIASVKRLFYTHWHPDHTGGMHSLEQLNLDWRKKGKKRVLAVTDVYLPEWVKKDFDNHLGLSEHLAYFESLGIVRQHILDSGTQVQLNNVTIEGYEMPNPSLTVYIIKSQRSKLVLALDDTKNWIPQDAMKKADVAVLEKGWFEYDKQGKQVIDLHHPIRRSEASFEETLRITRSINAKRTILTHIEELDRRSYDDYRRLERERRCRELNVKFAYDGMRISFR